MPWTSLRSSFPPVQVLLCPTFWVCDPSLKDTHGRRLLYALLRCSAPVLCSRDATEGHSFQWVSRGNQDNSRRAPILVQYAHKCWTGATRTSDLFNSAQELGGL